MTTHLPGTLSNRDPGDDVCPGSLPGSRLLDFGFVSLAFLFFSWTVVFQLGRWSGWSFGSLCWIWMIPAAICLGVVGFRARKFLSGGGTSNLETRRAGIGCVLLSILFLGLELCLSNSHSDIFIYLAGPAFVSADASAAPDFRLYGLFMDGPAVKHYYFIPYTYEYLLAAFSYFSRIPFPTVALMIQPALIAALVPLAWYLLLSHFTERVYPALFGVVGVLVFLSLTGDTHRSYGNFGLVRLADNKGILFNLLFPLIAAKVLHLYRAEGRAHGLGLFGLFSASAGLTLNALFMVPCLAGLVGGGAIVVDLFRKRAPRIRFFAAGLLASSYLLAVFVAYGMSRQPSFRSWEDPETRESFSRHLGLTFGSWSSTQSILMVLSLGVCSVWIRRLPYQRLLGWLGLHWILLFNPLAYGLIRTFMGWGEISSYWRYIFLAPLPLMFAVAWLPLVERWVSSWRRALGVLAFSFGLIVGGTVLFPERAVYGGLVRGDRPHDVKFTPFSARGKLNGMSKDLERLKDVDLPSPMLSTHHFGLMLPIFRPDVEQVVTKPNIVNHLAVYRRDEGISETRNGASDFVRGRSPDFGNFRTVVKTLGVRTLLLNADLSKHPAIREFLKNQRFVHRLDLPDSARTLWVREE